MYTASTTAPTVGPLSWFRRAESWLDARGRAAWIAAMVLGFVFAWPIGLGLLAYMIWSKRMSKSFCRGAERPDRMGRFDSLRPSGNSAFDAYKTDMLRRLEDEQAAFEAFLQRLRAAKDKSEFDAFMEDRARATAQAAQGPTEEDRGGAY